MNILKIDERLENIERLLLTNKTVLTFEEGCTYTGFKASYLYKLTSSNKIPYSKPNNGAIFFDKKKLDNWLLSNYQKSTSESKQEALNYTLKNKR